MFVISIIPAGSDWNPGRGKSHLQTKSNKKPGFCMILYDFCNKKTLDFVGSKGSWRISVLCVLPARPAVIEDEDGDLAMPRGTPEPEPNGGRIDPSIAGAVWLP